MTDTTKLKELEQYVQDKMQLIVSEMDTTNKNESTIAIGSLNIVKDKIHSLLEEDKDKAMNEEDKSRFESDRIKYLSSKKWRDRHASSQPSAGNREIEFAKWILKSDWQRDGDCWVTRAGNYIHGIIKEVKSSEQIYQLFLTQTGKPQE